MERYLFAFDFDGTIAKTFEPAPSSVGVTEAYKLAIEDLFGKTGLEIYNKQGGLKNRAPSELVFDLLAANQESQVEMLSQSWTFFKCREETLRGFVPEGKGYPLNGDQENLRPENLLAEVMTRQKLVYLQDQIGQQMEHGTIWPRLTSEFGNFWNQLQLLKQRGIPLTTAVISSGHELFILRTFEKHDLQKPDILVSEDDTRGKNFPTGKLLVKPNPFPFAIAHRKFNELGGGDKSRMVYFGDDPIKDGQMAARSRIVFGHFNPALTGLDLKTDQFAFGDWSLIMPKLLNSTKLREGTSIRELISV